MVSYANTPDKKNKQGERRTAVPPEHFLSHRPVQRVFSSRSFRGPARNPGPCRVYTRHFAFGETGLAGHTPVLGFCFACVPVAFGWLFWFHLA